MIELIDKKEVLKIIDESGDLGEAHSSINYNCNPILTIPNNPTNGDMIKAIFRHIKGSVLTDHKEVMVVSYKDFINWLNAPYKSDSDKESKK